MHAHLRTTYYNLVRQIIQAFNCNEGAKYEFPSVEGTHTALKERGTEDVAVPEALV